MVRSGPAPGPAWVALAQVGHRQAGGDRRPAVIGQERLLSDVEEMGDRGVGVAGVEPGVGGVALRQPVVRHVGQVALKEISGGGPLMVVEAPVGVGGQRLGVVVVDAEGLAQESLGLLRMTARVTQQDAHPPLGLVSLREPDGDQDRARYQKENADKDEQGGHSNHGQDAAEDDLGGGKHGVAVDQHRRCTRLGRRLTDRAHRRCAARGLMGVVAGVAGVVDAGAWNADGAPGAMRADREVGAPGAEAPAQPGLGEVEAHTWGDRLAPPQPKVAHGCSVPRSVAFARRLPALR